MNRAARRKDDAQRRMRANEQLRVLISTRPACNAAVREVHADTDAWHANNMHPGVTCSRGCSSCCWTVVMMELAEADYLVASYPNEVARAMPELKRQAKVLYDSTNPQDWRDLSESGRAGPANERIANVYADIGIRCAFLSEQGECTVYEARPLGCRTHFAVGDPAECKDRHGRQLLWSPQTRLGAQFELTKRVAEMRKGLLAVGCIQSLVPEAWDMRHKSAVRR